MDIKFIGQDEVQNYLADPRNMVAKIVIRGEDSPGSPLFVLLENAAPCDSLTNFLREEAIEYDSCTIEYMFRNNNA